VSGGACQPSLAAAVYNAVCRLRVLRLWWESQPAQCPRSIENELLCAWSAALSLSLTVIREMVDEDIVVRGPPKVLDVVRGEIRVEVGAVP
jgi:hypothetical protein